MIKKLLILAGLSFMLSGCFMAPLAFIGPATSGFTTASLVQSGISTTANYLVKKNTGKTIAQHAVAKMINEDLLKQSFNTTHTINTPKIPKK